MMFAAWTSYDTALVLMFNTAAIVVIVWRIVRSSRRQLNNRLDQLNEVVGRLESAYKYQHRQATYVGTLQGYWHVLMKGLDEGGLDPSIRRMIYEAGLEMFEKFHAELADGEDVDGQGTRLWVDDDERRNRVRTR